MLERLKVVAREAIPPAAQVPAKYWLDRVRGLIEPEMALLPLLVRAGERAIDIGANRGTYAYALARIGARVEAFEPNPSCTRSLRAWAAGNPSVRVHDVGLSDHAGTDVLHVPVLAGIEHDASASIEPHDFRESREHRIALRTLDQYGFDEMRLVKIDVEGHESRVVAGAVGSLRRSMPALLVEIEQRHQQAAVTEVFQRILALGYQGHFLDGDSIRPLSQFDPARDQDLSAFSSRERRYINNFLFLDAGARARLEAGWRFLDA